MVLISRELTNMRGFSRLISLTLLLVRFLGEANYAAKSDTNGSVYIVYMGASTWQNGTHRSDYTQLLTAIKTRNKSSIVQTYNRSLLGFAALLSEEEAKAVRGKPGVVSVSRDRVLQLQTTRSWDFLWTQNEFIMDKPPTSSFHSHDMGWPNYGAQDTIIGILDTGIRPESPSFSDEYMGPIPRRWKGICQAANNFYSSSCNRKIIGARFYDDPDDPGYIRSPMDEDGHDTFVASIAAGNPVWGASYYGLAHGVARGGSPSSRIAVYSVCATEGCVGSSILKAFDDAIADGVDVLSMSFETLAGIFDLIDDPISIGAFHATEKGIVVVGSGGNQGPKHGTVRNVFPWVMTVAATTLDRDFEAQVLLWGNVVVKGGGINFSDLSKAAVYRLIDGRSSSKYDDRVNASNCIPGSLHDDQVRGAIVLCENKKGMYGPIKKFKLLAKQGAIGMILIDDIGWQVPFTYGTSPIAIVSEGDGDRIRAYINSTRNASATILPTRSILKSTPAPVVAVFSSRGPILDIPNLLKPDVAAPGVGILGAWLPNDTKVAILGKKPPLFNILSGTSMSCPHVSGLAAVVKFWHPTWSPSAIRSAIMTTAITTNNLHAPITTQNGSTATPYDMGAGEISLLGPLQPGLVYETETIDYVRFLCNLGYNSTQIKTMSSTVDDNFSCPSNSSPDLISDMNYPSIAISSLKAHGSKTIKRTVTNVCDAYSTYTAVVEAPASLQVQVVPRKLRFTKHVRKLSFQVTFKRTTSSLEDMFGSITWTDLKHKVRSPFVVSSS